MRVLDLKKLNFSSLNLADKVNIKENERPVPLLHLTQVQPGYKNRKGFTRKFDASVYEKTLWLCGCEETNAFFCFVCLLFGGDDIWTKEGVRDLKHLSEKLKKHAKSVKHMNNSVSFQLLGKTDIASCLSGAYAQNIRKHNEMVSKNRHVLSKIIDILKLCGKCNLALRGHNERDDSINKGIFLTLVDYTKNLDSVLCSHLQETKGFKGTSKTIQNELLDCILRVCRDQILSEIKQSQFLALMADDTTDVSTQTQTVLVFRYFLTGKIHERFWSFSNPESQDAVGISTCILEQIDPILKDSPEKLIAQTYDGAAVMRGHLRGVNVEIQEIYKNAHYIYCYAHQFNKLLEKAMSSTPSVRIFFANINGISAFFSNSPNRTAALNQVMDKRIERPSQTRWNFQSRAIQTVFENRGSILECFENIMYGIPKIYNTETTIQAAGFAKWLNDSTFQYWLNLFYKLMPHVDILFNQLQKIQTDAVKLQCAIDNFENMVVNIRNSLPPVTQNMEVTKEKKNRIRKEENLNLSAREICDTIIFQIKERFAFKNHFSGAKLFQTQNYAHYRKKLPVEDIDIFCDAFPMVEKRALKLELTIFYSRPEIREDNENVPSCLRTLNLIVSYGLDSIFCEICKVLLILITMPMTTAETERCFSTLKLIKTFLRNTMTEERLTALAMLSIEKTLIEEIPDFNEKVIEMFACDKNRRLELHFKK